MPHLNLVVIVQGSHRKLRHAALVRALPLALPVALLSLLVVKSLPREVPMTFQVMQSRGIQAPLVKEGNFLVCLLDLKRYESH